MTTWLGGALAPTLQSRLAGRIRAQIESGELAPGDSLPSEAELGHEHSVSRDTVRGALRTLEGEGLIESGQGRGRRVRRQHQYDHHAVFAEATSRPDGTDSFVSEAAAANLPASTSFEMRIEGVSDDVARRLGCNPGDLVVVRDVTRYIDDVPFSRQTTYYPRKLAEELGFDTPHDIQPGTTRVLADAGYVETGYYDELTSRMPSPAEAEKLGIGTGTPLIILTRTAVATEMITRVTQSAFPADRHRILYELGDFQPAERNIKGETE